MQEEPTKRANTVILGYYLCHSYKTTVFLLQLSQLSPYQHLVAFVEGLKKTGNNEIILEIREIQGGQCLKCKWQGHEN